jgi:hypothetical protein
VVEREFDHPSGVQEQARLTGGNHVNPALRCATIFEIVVQPHPDLTDVENRPPQVRL